MFVETTSLLLPARSPMLPVVDVRLTLFEVSVEAKFEPPMLSRADNVIEFEPFILAARAKPPLVAFMFTSVPPTVAPATELMVPLESTLNEAPAADAVVKLLVAAVF